MSASVMYVELDVYKETIPVAVAAVVRLEVRYGSELGHRLSAINRTLGGLPTTGPCK